MSNGGLTITKKEVIPPLPFIRKSMSTPWNFHSGAKYGGGYLQKLGDGVDKLLRIDIHQVHLENNFVCGTVTWVFKHGSQLERVKFSKKFDGEIISQQYPFHAEKWGMQSHRDQMFWSKFEPFKVFAESFKMDNVDYGEVGKEYVFMRWKEYPEINPMLHHLPHGFFYICLSKWNGRLEGFYQERDSNCWCDTS